jgi:hypothetical protein
MIATAAIEPAPFLTLPHKREKEQPESARS